MNVSPKPGRLARLARGARRPRSDDERLCKNNKFSFVLNYNECDSPRLPRASLDSATTLLYSSSRYCGRLL